MLLCLLPATATQLRRLHAHHSPAIEKLAKMLTIQVCFQGGVGKKFSKINNGGGALKVIQPLKMQRFYSGVWAVPLNIGLSPLPMANTGLVARGLNGSGSAPLQLDRKGIRPKELKGFGQESVALGRSGEEEKALTGHGYKAIQLESRSGRKPILIHVQKVKPKMLFSN